MHTITVKYIELTLLITLALISDIKTFKIKNSIILVFAVAGLLTNLFLSGLPGVAASMLAAALPCVLLGILYVLRMLGAGDIKLFCAVGAIAGIGFVLYGIAFSFLAGGVMALAIMLLNKSFKQRAVHFLTYIKTCFLTLSLQPYTDFSDKSDGAKFRFSFAIACGVIIEALRTILA